MFNLYYRDSSRKVSGSINYDNYKNLTISKSDKEGQIKFIIDEIQIFSISYTEVDELLEEIINDENLLFDWFKYFIESNILKEEVINEFINLGFNNVKAMIDRRIVSNKEIIHLIYLYGPVFLYKIVEKTKQKNSTGILLTSDSWIKSFIILALLSKICAIKRNAQ